MSESSKDENESDFFNLGKNKERRMQNIEPIITKKNLAVILVLLISFIIILLINLFLQLKNSEVNVNKYFETPVKDINHIFPRNNLNNDKYIPTKQQILESRELYINDKNLIPEYIQFFKTLNGNEEKIY